MKAIPLFFFTYSLLLSSPTSEVEAYRKGFEHGLKMLEFQIENEGMSPQKIDVDFQYTVELNTKDLSTTEILYLQYLTARDGYQSKLIKGALIFGKFERLADAKQIAETLKRKYNFDAVTKELKPNDEIYSYPVLLLKAFNKFEKMNEAAKASKEIFQVNTFTEETIKPMPIQTLKPKIEEKPKVEEKPVVIAPKKDEITPLVFQEQKPLKIVEQNTTIAPQEPQKEIKAPLAIVEEVKPVQTPKIDENLTKVEPKVEKTEVKQPKEVLTQAIAQNEPIKTKNDTKDTKNLKNDTNNTKGDTKKIENVVVKDFPFMKEDINASIAQKPKDLNLEETIAEALAVYPDFDKEQLRANILKLVVNTPWIDAEAVKTMPMTKGLLLQLLKVAKEKE